MICMLAAERPQLGNAKLRDVAAVEDDLAGGGFDQPDDAAPKRGLAAAGFADDAQRFAILDRERHAVDGPHGLAAAAEKRRRRPGNVW